MAQRTAQQAYRHLLRTISIVFDKDIPTQMAANHQARVMFEKYIHETDPKKVKYLIGEADAAAEALYRDIMKVEYNPVKQSYTGIVEKRHLKFDNGVEVYTRPDDRGIIHRNPTPISAPKTNTPPPPQQQQQPDTQSI